jgi:hypothetical protein
MDLVVNRIVLMKEATFQEVCFVLGTGFVDCDRLVVITLAMRLACTRADI